MKNVIQLLVILCICSMNSPAQSAKNVSSIEMQIRKLEKIQVEALLKHDVAKLSELFDDELAVNAPINRISTKAGVLQLVRERKISYSAFETTIEQIQVFGDMVVVMGRETVHPIDNSPLTGTVANRRYTQVWKKRNGKWLLAARHASVICQQ